MHSVAHGVIRLEELSPEYGAERRRLRVIKYRGQRFRGGYHDFVIATGGVRVFPRLVSAEHRTSFKRDVLGNAVAGAQRAARRRRRARLEHADPGPGRNRQVAAGADLRRRRDRAAARRAAMFIFDEELGLLFERAKGLGIDLQAMVDSGKLVDRAGRCRRADARANFPQRVRRLRREQQGAQTVVIDSLNGYQAAMPEEQALILHMHELLQYLNRQGASTFLTVAQHGLVGDMKAPVDVTYLADTVILLRYFEALGRVRRAISVDQEAHRRPRGHDPRISHRRPRHHARRAADRLPGRASRRAGAGRRGAPLLDTDRRE